MRNEAVWGLGGLGAEEVLFGDGRGGVEDGFEEGEGGPLFRGSRLLRFLGFCPAVGALVGACGFGRGRGMFCLDGGYTEFVEFALAGFAGEGEFLLEGVGFGLPLGLRFGTLMGGFRSEPGGFGVAGALGAVKFGEGASVCALPVGAVAVDLVEGWVVGVRLDIAAVLVVDIGEDGGGVA